MRGPTASLSLWKRPLTEAEPWFCRAVLPSPRKRGEVHTRPGNRCKSQKPWIVNR